MAKSQHAPRYRLIPGLLRKLRQGAGLTQRQLAEKLRTYKSTPASIGLRSLNNSCSNVSGKVFLTEKNLEAVRFPPLWLTERVVKL